MITTLVTVLALLVVAVALVRFVIITNVRLSLPALDKFRLQTSEKLRMSGNMWLLVDPKFHLFLLNPLYRTPNTGAALDFPDFYMYMIERYATPTSVVITVVSAVLASLFHPVIGVITCTAMSAIVVVVTCSTGKFSWLAAAISSELGAIHQATKGIPSVTSATRDELRPDLRPGSNPAVIEFKTFKNPGKGFAQVQSLTAAGYQGVKTIDDFILMMLFDESGKCVYHTEGYREDQAEACIDEAFNHMVHSGYFSDKEVREYMAAGLRAAIEHMHQQRELDKDTGL